MSTATTQSAPLPYPGDALIPAVRQHVLNLWNERHDARLVYHNYAQAAETARLAAGIAEAENIPEDVAAIAVLAAWFHNTGYLYDPNPAPESHAIRAEFFLAEQHCAPEKIQQVRQCIIAALTEQRPKTAEARVLSDAVRAYNWAEHVDTRAPLLRLERELTDGQALSDPEWQAYLLEQLQHVLFFTATAKTNYEPALATQRLRLQPAAATAPTPLAEKPAGALPTRFARLARRPLRSSIQTFFRVNYANHLRLSAIADNKAHIMISVNSILMSVAISMLTYQSFTNNNPLFVLPIILFLRGNKPGGGGSHGPAAMAE